MCDYVMFKLIDGAVEAIKTRAFNIFPFALGLFSIALCGIRLIQMCKLHAMLFVMRKSDEYVIAVNERHMNAPLF